MQYMVMTDWLLYSSGERGIFDETKASRKTGLSLEKRESGSSSTFSSSSLLLLFFLNPTDKEAERKALKDGEGKERKSNDDSGGGG